MQPVHLREAELRKAFEALSWQELSACFRQPLADNDVSILTQTLLTSNKVMHRYPSAAQERARDSLLASLAQFASSELNFDAAAKIHHAISAIRIIEHGYRVLLQGLNATLEGSSSTETVSATLIGAAHQIHKAIEKSTEQATKAAIIDDIAFSLRDANGNIYSPDELIEATDASTAMIMAVHALREGWFDNDDAIVLPTLAHPEEDHFNKFLSLQRQAEAWVFWRSVEERRRFEGGTLERTAAEHVDGGARRELIRYTPEPKALAFHMSSIAGYERLNSEIASIYFDLAFRTNSRIKAKGFDRKAKLYPNDFISLSELESANALSLMLSTPIESDKAVYLGLRLVEWLRGYSALALLVDNSYRPKADAEALLVRLEPRDLYRHLARLGLTERKAKRFVDLVTFRKTSTEIVDNPLFRMADGQYLVFGPSLVGAVPARILLSKLAHAGIHIEGRGRRFENSVRQWLRSWRLETKSFKVRKNNEDYEFDAVVSWENYVFIFECKSQGLVAPTTINRYHAEQNFRSHIAQIKRLADALVRHPDILDDQFGEASTPRTIVPCLLNAMPFGLPGLWEGVYCTDAPALGCFFEKGAITLTATETLPKGSSVQHILGKRQLWRGQEPTPDDLIVYLNECPLHALALEHLEAVAIRVPIDEDLEVEAPQIFPKLVDLQKRADLLEGNTQSAKEKIRALASRLATD